MTSSAGLGLLAAGRPVAAASLPPLVPLGKSLVISTWDTGLAANLGAWKILSKGGHAPDAVEGGVMVIVHSTLGNAAVLGAAALCKMRPVLASGLPSL